MNKTVIFQNLGRIDYQKAWDYQEARFAEVVAIKLQNRNLPESEQLPTPNYILFCEHPPVFTLGKSGKPENLLEDDASLKELGIDYYKINRGGDITFHGPGQLVGYPILDLDNFFTDIHKYMRFLEEAIIRTLADFGIVAGRIAGLTGVWLDAELQQNSRKICAMGVKSSRWVTMHGFALNVNTDLNYFQNIIPCGIDDKAVTSMADELGQLVDIQAVMQKIKFHLATIFEMKLVENNEFSTVQ